ncbi:hypothetical protein [Paenarthrobacter sp. PH39-S1]|nr:hypothetical protein [Paenarthrobacter sp. PH39-S1]MDJ0355440.1 hypothetical protein [Paenarthrobacter sp. PH39-S1]
MDRKAFGLLVLRVGAHATRIAGFDIDWTKPMWKENSDEDRE